MQQLIFSSFRWRIVRCPIVDIDGHFCKDSFPIAQLSDQFANEHYEVPQLWTDPLGKTSFQDRFISDDLEHPFSKIIPETDTKVCINHDGNIFLLSMESVDCGKRLRLWICIMGGQKEADKYVYCLKVPFIAFLH